MSVRCLSLCHLVDKFGRGLDSICVPLLTFSKWPLKHYVIDMNKPGTSPRSTYEEQNDWVVPFLLFMLMLMGEAWRYGGWSCLLLTPLFIPGRIDFPWKLSDVKGLLALWCQHSVIPLSVFLNIISGTLFSPFSSVVLIFSPFYLSSLFTLHLLMPPVFPFQLLLLLLSHFLSWLSTVLEVTRTSLTSWCNIQNIH